ncbi:hypothetical protein RDABS01_002425 [Bienertia sinuspersici]
MNTEVPNQHNNQSVEECVKIEIEDIQHDIDYWSSSLYAYVLGANPPTSVMDGFIRRVWKEHAVDKVINVKKGLFLVHFKTMDQCNKAKEGEKIFFDSKPVLIKAWSQETDMDLDNIMTIPIWVHVHAHYKYWSHKSLEKLTKGIGKFVKVDHTTANRDRLAYARCMVEKKVQQENKETARTKDTRKEEWMVVTSKNKKQTADEIQCNQEGEGGNNPPDPGNAELARIEKEAAKDYNKKNKCFSQFLRQKAKIKWIQEGDANTRLFHRSLKAQRLKSNIHAIQDLNGNICNSPEYMWSSTLWMKAQL